MEELLEKIRDKNYNVKEFIKNQKHLLQEYQVVEAFMKNGELAIYRAIPEHYKKDKKLAELFVTAKPMNYKAIDESLKNDVEFNSRLINKNYLIGKFFTKEFLDNEIFCRSLIGNLTQGHMVFIYMTDRLKKDRQFLEFLISKCPNLLSSFDNDVIDEELIKLTLTYGIKKAVEDDKGFDIYHTIIWYTLHNYFISEKGEIDYAERKRILNHILNLLKENDKYKYVIFYLISFSQIIRLAETQEEKESLLSLAISKNIYIYLHSPKYIRDKDELFITALRSVAQEEPIFLFHAGHILNNREFKENDAQILLDLSKEYPKLELHKIFVDLPNELKNDYSLALQAIEHYAGNFLHIGEELRNNTDFIKDVLKVKPFLKDYLE